MTAEVAHPLIQEFLNYLRFERHFSPHTAKFHVGSILAELGAASRTEAVMIATRKGILSI